MTDMLTGTPDFLVNKIVFTGFTLPAPFELTSLAYQAFSASSTTVAVECVAAIYEGFEANGRQHRPFRPLTSADPDGTFSSRFLCDTTERPEEAVGVGASAYARIPLRPDPLHRDPILLLPGVRYWVAAVWGGDPAPGVIRTRTIPYLGEYTDVLDLSRSGNQTYDPSFDFITYDTRQLESTLNGEPPIYVAPVHTQSPNHIHTASVDWELAGRWLVA